ncbi:MAG: hypothetical protein DDT39_00825 [Firmicutes bacterium]|nr:hypothetical protein [candidate division NPL-UPA2 bacterium]
MRSARDEASVLALLKRYGFKQQRGVAVLDDEEAALEFFLRGVPELAQSADIFYNNDFKPLLRYPGRVSAGVKLNMASGLLEMTVDYGNMQPKEFVELMSAYRLKKRYHRLKDGSFMTLESPEFAGVAGLLDNLGISATELTNQKIELPKYRVMYIDSLSRDTTGLLMERSSAFKKMVQDLQEPQDLEVTVPESLQHILRDYQVTGFRWLKTMASYGLGGVLADDMGLGKTLQVIALVLSDKATSSSPSLVIAPTSLLYNWEAEVQKFAPELRVVVIAGQPDERQRQIRRPARTPARCAPRRAPRAGVLAVYYHACAGGSGTKDRGRRLSLPRRQYPLRRTHALGQ